MSRCSRGLVLTASLCLVPAVFTRAQDLPLRVGPRPSDCRFDTGGGSDSLDFTLFLTPPRSVSKSARRPEQYTPYINAIASTFEQPRRLILPYWPWKGKEEAEPKK